MTPAAGFTSANIDTGLLDDPKMRALWRSLRDPERMARAVILYLAAVLGSWAAGERRTAEDAAPHYLDPDADLLAALAAARLLDAEYRIPQRAWTAWYGPAYGRREKLRGGGQLAGLMSHGMTYEEAISEALRRQNSPPAPTQPEPSSNLAGAQPDQSVSPSIYPSVRPTGLSATTLPRKNADDDERAAEKADQDEYIRSTGIVPAPARMSHPEKAGAILASIRPQLTPKESATP